MDREMELVAGKSIVSQYNYNSGCPALAHCSALH